MKKLLPVLFSLFLIVLCISCNKNEIKKTESEKEETKVNASIGFRSYTPISKADYLALSIPDKKEAWVKKLNYILNTQTLNGTQENLIANLIDAINALEGGEASQDLYDIAILLVAEFSQEDYINTFASLEDNTLSGTNTPTCSFCMSELTTGGGSFTNAFTTSLADCNCRWTCGDPFSTSSCVNPNCCEPTTDGCGFMLWGPCDGLDSL